MGSPFPKTLADLSFAADDDDDAVAPANIYGSIKALRRATLSIPNRLRSILQDAEFVQRVVGDNPGRNPPGPLPLIANERCGSWYVPPGRKAGTAYFKSTDGHHGQWDFSLRRLNLAVLGVVGAHGGAVLVDSTRRGKAVPDALAKTVPIWAAVWNRVLFPGARDGFHRLQQPRRPYSVAGSELAQIEARLGGFARALADLGLDLERLRGELVRPIKLYWAVEHDATLLSSEGDLGDGPDESRNNRREYYPLILCCASRRVHGAEVSQGGYIQGAGDDSEGWSRGLTPQLFWRHKDILLETPESEQPGLIRGLLDDAEASRASGAPGCVELVHNLYIGRQDCHPVKYDAVTGAAGGNGEEQTRAEPAPGLDFGLVVRCHGHTAPAGSATGPIDLGCRTGKLGSKDLRHGLRHVVPAVAAKLKQDPQTSVLVTCETGRDLAVGVALVILCLFYDDAHAREVKNLLLCPEPCRRSGAQQGRTPVSPKQDMAKAFVRQRLAWIVAAHPDANPSRSTLQAVNAFLIQRPQRVGGPDGEGGQLLTTASQMAPSDP